MKSAMKIWKELEILILQQVAILFISVETKMHAGMNIIASAYSYPPFPHSFQNSLVCGAANLRRKIGPKFYLYSC
jgi:hypothetical protein